MSRETNDAELLLRMMQDKKSREEQWHRPVATSVMRPE